MVNKQTAVEWLVNEIDSNLLVTEKVKLAVEQAKQMEKEQIIDAYNVGYITDFKLNSDYTTQTPEQYYNETFKSE